MLNFKNYITEAKVSKRNLDKVADIFKRIVEKNLRTKLFRFGGPRGFCEINRGLGILYFYNRNKAMRLNYIGNEIVSITLWDKYVLDQPGDLTIDLDGLGLLQAGKELISILRNPRTGTIQTIGDLEESGFPKSSEARQYMYEASRVSPKEFAQIAQDNLPRGEELDRVSWDTIKNIADQKDILVPSVIRHETAVPGTKGKNKKFNLQQILIGDVKDDVDKPARETEPVYFLKITSQDPNTKKFTSVKGDAKAEKMLKRAGKALAQPNVSEEMEHPDTLFGRMRNLVQVVVRGTRNALVIYGGPGIGKTFVVNKTVEEEGLQKNRDYFIVKGKITTTSLYQTLFMHREGSLLIFDDTDSVWGNEDSANILKAALDSYEDRTISWFSPRTVNVSKMSEEDRESFNAEIDRKLAEDPEGKIKFPSEFEYNGRIVFISNLTEDKFDSAVLNRAAKIDMTLTEDQIFLRMKSILEHMGDSSVPVDVKEEILDFLWDEMKDGNITAPSMRTYVAAEDLYRSGLPNWKELLPYV